VKYGGRAIDKTKDNQAVDKYYSLSVAFSKTTGAPRGVIRV
jgi:hypothetical protein